MLVFDERHQVRVVLALDDEDALGRVVVVPIDILVRSRQSVHRFHSLLFAQDDRPIPPPMRVDDPTLDDVSL